MRKTGKRREERLRGSAGHQVDQGDQSSGTRVFQIDVAFSVESCHSLGNPSNNFLRMFLVRPGASQLGAACQQLGCARSLC